ncbi:MAG: YciI family protein [Chloroflexota bacterium]
MSEAPVIESVWLVEATCAPDAAETRKPFRAAHLARLLELKDAGIIVEAGAFMDVSSSIVLVRAESEEAALAVCRDDVYMRNGVWVEVRARPFGRVVRGAG